jgi:hypothetical protein
MADAPRLTPEKQREHAAREQRLAQALRDNLRRRKEQTRTRAADPAPNDEPSVEPDRSLP